MKTLKQRRALIRRRIAFNDKVTDTWRLFNSLCKNKDVLTAVAQTILAGRRLYFDLPKKRLK